MTDTVPELADTARTEYRDDRGVVFYVKIEPLDLALSDAVDEVDAPDLPGANRLPDDEEHREEPPMAA